MPIYDMTISLNPASVKSAKKYRIDVENYERAKDMAMGLFLSEMIPLFRFQIDGKESEDQESEVDFDANGFYIKSQEADQ